MMRQCRKFKFWRRWLESAGQADSALVESAPTYLIYKSLYHVIMKYYEIHMCDYPYLRILIFINCSISSIPGTKIMKFGLKSFILHFKMYKTIKFPRIFFYMRLFLNPYRKFMLIFYFE